MANILPPNLNDPQITIKIEAKEDNLKPYEHQKAAWNALSRCFIDEGHSAGIVVVPTGGGKTIIATRWLLENHLRQGGRVLWFAHRLPLLRQAQSAFALSASIAFPKPYLKLIRISGDDCSWSEVHQEDDVVFTTIHSAAREDNEGFIEQFVKQSEAGIFVVVDEAHHASAPQYFRLLTKLKQQTGMRLLGLTATPIRMNDMDSRRLWHIFDTRLIYEIRNKELIEKGILSVPHPETVQTKITQEKEFTEQDMTFLQRWGDLGPKVLERLAKNTTRNKLIVDHYRKNVDRYGKTILFAIDTLHAQTLALEFNKAGIAADYVDYQRTDNGIVLDAFRSEAAPAVIANVEILTEGFDAPKTRTVFLCRPTRSEALLAQMVGRALRGPKAGGTEDAYLVTFVDTWSFYNPLDAKYAVIKGEVDSPETPPSVPHYILIIHPDLIAAAYRLVQSAFKGELEGYYACLPHSWYVWEQMTNDDIVRRQVLVFENQMAGYQHLQADIIDHGQIPPALNEDYAANLIRRYFDDIPDPLPSINDIWSLLNAYNQGCSVQHYTFQEKQRFDPRRIAPHLKNLPPAQRFEEVQKIFNEDAVCRLVYQNEVDTFDQDVREEIERLLRPRAYSSPIPQLTTSNRILTPWPDETTGHNLSKIWDNVTSQPLHFPRGAPKISDIRFSKQPLKNVWSFYRHRDRTIMISSLLNSPDVPRLVLEFLLYHELLHADMPYSGHDANFRHRERKCFTPSDEAKEEAKMFGLVPGNSPDAWRVLAEQFLYTFHRIYRTETALSALTDHLTQEG